MSNTFFVTRDIPCDGDVYPGSQSIPQGSTVIFVGSPAPNRVEVSWKGRSVTMLARDFAERTEARPLAAAAKLAS